MPRDDDPPDVGLAGGADALGIDEELPQPPRRELPGTSAQRRAVAVMVAVLLVLGLALRTVVSHGHHAAAAPAPTRTPTASVTPRGLSATWEVNPPDPAESDIILALPNGGGLVHVPGVMVAPAAAGRCPTDDLALTCVMSTEVSPEFLAAVAAVFPGARQTSARTVATGGTGDAGHALHYARLTAQVGRLQILILVLQSAAATGPQIASDDGRRTVIYRTHRVDGYDVQIEISAPSGSELSAAAVDRLAADPRLLTSP